MSKIFFLFLLYPVLVKAQIIDGGFPVTTNGVPVLKNFSLTSYFNESKGADIASATTTDIGIATGNYFDVTGTVTITALGTVQAGTRRTVRFTGALILTHNATSLILPGGANITTVAGDVFEFTSLGSGNWRCTAYLPITTTGTGAAVYGTSPSFTTGIKIGGSAATNTMLKGNGTNYVASTETYAAPGTSGNVMKSDGTNWTSAANTGEWTTLQVAGSDVTTTGQTLVDITGLVTPTLTVSSNYEIEAMLIISTSAVATGTEYGINCSGTSTTQGIIYIGPTTVTAGVQVMAEDGTNTNNTAASPAMLTTASETGVVWIRGIVGTGTGSPTIAIRHLKVTSGSSTVKIGSSFKYRKL